MWCRTVFHTDGHARPGLPIRFRRTPTQRGRAGRYNVRHDELVRPGETGGAGPRARGRRAQTRADSVRRVGTGGVAICRPRTTTATRTASAAFVLLNKRGRAVEGRCGRAGIGSSRRGSWDIRCPTTAMERAGRVQRAAGNVFYGSVNVVRVRVVFALCATGPTRTVRDGGGRGGENRNCAIGGQDLGRTKTRGLGAAWRGYARQWPPSGPRRSSCRLGVTGKRDGPGEPVKVTGTGLPGAPVP